MGLRDRLKGAIKKAVNKDSGPSAMERRAAARKDLPTAPDAEGYTAVAASDLLVDGKGTTFAVRGKNVAVFRLDGKIFAIADACTHEDGPLGEGSLDGSVVTCPYHDWRFDVKTGACITNSSRPVGCFAAR